MDRKTKDRSKKVAGTVITFLEEAKEQELLFEVARRLQKNAQNVAEDTKIKVTSAVRLDADEKKRLQVFFKSILNHNYQVENKIEPNILGGLRIEWGDFMLDMTLKQRINQLKEKIYP